MGTNKPSTKQLTARQVRMDAAAALDGKKSKPERKPRRKKSMGTLPGAVDAVFQALFRDGSAVLLMPTGSGLFTAGSLHVTFRQSGSSDRFGVPEHDHSPMGLSPKPETLDQILDRLTRLHGPVEEVSPAWSRTLAPGLGLILYGMPVLTGRGFNVVGARMDAPVEEPASETMNEIGIPEHSHWFAATSPLPFSAAYWIFRHMTAEQLLADIERCNCQPPMPQGEQPDPIFVAHPSADPWAPPSAGGPYEDA